MTESKTHRKLPAEDIIKYNVPTGLPLVFELDDDCKPVKSYFLGDEEAIRAAQEAVANRGKPNKSHFNMKRSTIVLLSIAVFFVAFCITAKAQGTDLGSASIYTGDGYLFIHNGKNKSFTMEIKSKTIKPLTVGENPGFDVNGKIVQVIIVKGEHFLNGAKDADDQKMLELHQKWESDYLKNDMYHAALTLETEKISVSNRKTLFWGFKRPSLDKEFDRDYFLTTIIGADLVGLSSPLKIGDTVADYKKIFVDAFSTIKVSDKPFDVTKLAEQIRKGTYKGS